MAERIEGAIFEAGANELRRQDRRVYKRLPPGEGETAGSWSPMTAHGVPDMRELDVGDVVKIVGPNDVAILGDLGSAYWRVAKKSNDPDVIIVEAYKEKLV